MRNDRRLHRRYPLQLPIILIGSSGRQIVGITRDVSSGGVSFYLDLPLPSGIEIEYTLMFPATFAEVRCAGRIVRSWVAREGKFALAAIIDFFTLAGA
jgi:hypothetical protein